MDRMAIGLAGERLLTVALRLEMSTVTRLKGLVTMVERLMCIPNEQAVNGWGATAPCVRMPTSRLLGWLNLANVPKFTSEVRIGPCPQVGKPQV
jgi:hypothetical protein